MLTVSIETFQKTTCPNCGRVQEFEASDPVKNGDEVLCVKCCEWYVVIDEKAN